MVKVIYNYIYWLSTGFPTLFIESIDLFNLINYYAIYKVRHNSLYSYKTI